MEKNIESLTTITQLKSDEVLTLFSKLNICIVFNSPKKYNSEVTVLTILNILCRFNGPKIYYKGPHKLLEKIPNSQKGKIIRVPNLSGKKFDMVIALSHRLIKAKNVIYICSEGWSVFLSNKPCKWRHSVKNRLSAIYIAALVSGEVFKYGIQRIVNVEFIKEFSLDLISFGELEQPVLNPKIPELLNINEIVLVGCGAIGQAIIYCLSDLTSLTGKILLLDNDHLEPSNFQRYILLYPENFPKIQMPPGMPLIPNLKEITPKIPKPDFCANILRSVNPLLEVKINRSPYEVAITNDISIYQATDIIAAVDNIKSRINIQGALSKTTWNGWTSTNIGELSYGIGKHKLDSDYYCLACSYYPDGKSPTQLELDEKMTGIPVNEIKRRLDENDIIYEEDITKLLEINSLRPDQVAILKTTINQPFSTLFHGDCGIYNFRNVETHEPTPAPHTAVLAGVLLTSQLILSKINNNCQPLFENLADFNALGIPSSNSIFKLEKVQNCFCNDPIYIRAYESKWQFRI